MDETNKEGLKQIQAIEKAVVNV